MFKEVRYTKEDTSVQALALVIDGMIFQWDARLGFCCELCERTIADYGLSLEQFRAMVGLEGLRAMLDYYPEAFLHVGQNRYVLCEIVEPQTLEACR